VPLSVSVILIVREENNPEKRARVLAPGGAVLGAGLAVIRGMKAWHD